MERDLTSYGSQSIVATLKTVVARRPDEAFGTADPRIGKRSCVFGTSEKYHSVKLGSMRKSDPATGLRPRAASSTFAGWVLGARRSDPARVRQGGG